VQRIWTDHFFDEVKSISKSARNPYIHTQSDVLIVHEQKDLELINRLVRIDR
jgi:hypothetical protein